MDTNIRTRIEHFKAWVRNEISSGSEEIKSHKILLLKGILFDQGMGLDLRINNDRNGYRTDFDVDRNLYFPSSARFKHFPNGRYYLSEEFQDALWVVLDENGLL